MKDLQTRLNKITGHIRQEEESAIQLLKDYIRQYGEIDWSEEECPIVTTFYGETYYTAEVRRVTLESDGYLLIETDGECVCECSGAFTNDTILDILCSVIGNNEII